MAEDTAEKACGEVACRRSMVVAQIRILEVISTVIMASIWSLYPIASVSIYGPSWWWLFFLLKVIVC